ncbi:hypothetical protein DSO57_1004210 [Entomophthora muscae]|uniref:Uncharacterized protein n=1 Tax=Entomophthora muscae TaxID=34485 RepID=A0ACC2RN79_9FUNG|nr:hypothetical protein DSO57_1004210 [Entomophthora muscae]
MSQTSLPQLNPNLPLSILSEAKIQSLIPSVKNIPDNTLVQGKLLCAIELKEQNKKLQQLPLIGETATKQQAKESKIKNGFIPRPHAKPSGLPACTCHQPALVHLPAPASQSPSRPASRGWRTPHGGTVHPCQMGKLPKQEPNKRQFPTPNLGGTAGQFWNLPDRMRLTSNPANN